MTPRDQTILALLANGITTSREIAARLSLRERYIKNRISDLLRKTGAKNRTALAVKAVALDFEVREVKG